jgi:DNA-binding MarR family transcriptional regulator
LLDKDQNIKTDKVPAFAKLVKICSDAKAEATAKAKQVTENNAYRKILDELSAAMGGFENLTPEQFAELKEKASEQRDSEREADQRNSDETRFSATIDRIIKKGDDYAKAVMTALADRLGYTVHKMTKAERKETPRKSVTDIMEGMVNVKPSMPEEVEATQH